MLQLFRNNPGLMVSLALLGGGTFVCAILGVIMSRAGASLRPIFWFAGFFAIIVLPQFFGHLYKALHTTKTEVPRALAMARLAEPAVDTETNAAVRRADAKILFGPDADPQLVSDVRAKYGDVFANAEFAQFSMLPNGETVLLARFKSSSAAETAWVDYLRVTGLNQLDGKGDSERGYAVTRPVGDRAFALPFGNMLGIWTGTDDGTIRARMQAGGFDIPWRAPLAQVAVTPRHQESSGDAPVANSASATKASLPRTAMIAFALVAYLFVVVLYFFKGSAWAGTACAKPGTTPVAASEIARRLESINSLDVPFQIERGAQPNEFFATWRYADAKWIDLQRARGMKRTLRIRMVLDEARRTIRATDYVASFDWSAGRGGAELEWKTGLGIVFFQYEHQRVFGLQLDEQGRFKPELSYAYTFNLQEMKSPLIEAVTRAGWNWRPTVWQGPTWLRWLTE